MQNVKMKILKSLFKSDILNAIEKSNELKVKANNVGIDGKTKDRALRPP